MKTPAIKLLAVLFAALPLHAHEWPPTKDASRDSTINGRRMEIFQHGVRPEWGYESPQVDTFVMVHPVEERKDAPLYVVLHSAGHDVFRERP